MISGHELQPEDFAGSPLLARSRAWVSRTPFLPARHAKTTRAGVPKRDARGLQIGSPEHELRRLLGLAGFPEPVVVEPVRGTILGGREVAWREFQRRRESGEGRQAMGGDMGIASASRRRRGGRWPSDMPATLGWGCS